jgi:hypothetical protein
VAVSAAAVSEERQYLYVCTSKANSKLSTSGCERCGGWRREGVQVYEPLVTAGTSDGLLTAVLGTSDGLLAAVLLCCKPVHRYMSR